MVISAAVEAHKPILELLLTLASVGTFLSFTKLCYFTFFAKNEAIQAEDPPWNMQLAMGVTAFLCILYGVYPQALFSLLPGQPVSYHPYTAPHVVGVLQLFLWGGVVFTFRQVIAPQEGTVLDMDYFYRMCCRGIAWLASAVMNKFRQDIQTYFSRTVGNLTRLSRNPMMLLERLLGYPGLEATGISDTERHHGWRRDQIYNENRYRKSMGLGVLIAILMLFIYGLIYVLQSMLG
jgi:multicomponent Na+:H+ antiporter subunit D